MSKWHNRELPGFLLVLFVTVLLFLVIAWSALSHMNESLPNG